MVRYFPRLLNNVMHHVLLVFLLRMKRRGENRRSLLGKCFGFAFGFLIVAVFINPFIGRYCMFVSLPFSFPFFSIQCSAQFSFYGIVWTYVFSLTRNYCTNSKPTTRKSKKKLWLRWFEQSYSISKDNTNLGGLASRMGPFGSSSSGGIPISVTHCCACKWLVQPTKR